MKEKTSSINFYGENIFTGQFYGKYSVFLKKYLGIDFSRKCFVFSGQGSVYPGMFKNEYLANEIIRKRFEQADLLCWKYGIRKVSNYILGSKGDETAVNRSLCLLTLQIALFDMLMSKNIKPKIITSHSFGEFAAISASGIVSFEEMFDIVYHREIFSPPSNELGYMLAVKADKKRIKEILGEEEYYFSNYNSPVQTVISSAKDKIPYLSELLEGDGIKTKLLAAVPQPYHTPYLKPTSEKIRKYLESSAFNFKEPTVPLFSSVAKELITRKNFSKEKIKNILANQIIAPVDFIYQILSIYNLGCFTFLEIGPKLTFNIFVEDILSASGKEVKTIFIKDLIPTEKKIESSKVSIDLKKSKFFAMLIKIIAKVTGYKLEEISIEDRYQEDLGIDSIKKAEILLKVLEESKIPNRGNFDTAIFQGISDTVEYFEKSMKKPAEAQQKEVKEDAIAAKTGIKTDFRRYSLFWKPKPLDKQYLYSNDSNERNLILNLKDILISEKSALKQVEDQLREGESNIVLLSDGAKFDFISQISAQILQKEIDTLMSFIAFFQKLGKVHLYANFSLFLVSSGNISPFIAGLSSFLKSTKKESFELTARQNVPEFCFYKHIHFEKAVNKEDILNIIRKEKLEPNDINVLYKSSNSRYVSSLVEANAEDKPKLPEQSVIVAIGGAKGITFSLIKKISEQYKPIIYLAGRSPSAQELVRKNMNLLLAQNKNIYYRPVDATEHSSLEKLFKEIMEKHGRIDLLLNGAGVVSVGFFIKIRDKEIYYEFNNKVLPAFNVLHLSLKHRPKRIINFSSLVAEYGAIGQSIYACANEVMNKMTIEYNNLTDKENSSAICVNWPAWDNIGMTKNIGVFQKLKEYGARLLAPDDADRLFSYDISSADTRPTYYADMLDMLYLTFTLKNITRYYPILGRMEDRATYVKKRRLIFEKIIDSSSTDSYLKDHKSSLGEIMPASVGISAFLCLANLYFEEFPVLENFNVDSPFAVKEKPVKEEIILNFEDPKKPHLTIESNVIHFSCDAGKEEKRPRKAHFKSDFEVIIDFLYSKDYFFHGKRLQTIEKVFLDKEKQAIIQIDNRKLSAILGIPEYDRIILWLESAIQALGFAASLLRNFDDTLPVRIGKIITYFENEITDEIYILPSVTKEEKKDITGDVIVVNQEGDVIIEMKSIVLRKIGKYPNKILDIREVSNGPSF